MGKIRAGKLPEYKIYKCATSAAKGVPDGLETMRLRAYHTCAAPREGAIAMLWLSGANLNVCAVMLDSDAQSSAAPKNDRTWEKGDALEFFFQPAEMPNYVELHLAPNGATLELSFPSVEAFRVSRFEESFFVSGMTGRAEKFVSKSGLKGWFGHITVPLAVIGAGGGKLDGARAAVCRYNYNSQWGEKPELSSTVSFPGGSFHNPPAWHVIKI